MATKNATEIKIFNNEEILSSKKALRIKQQAAEIMVEEKMTGVIEDEPYAIITTPDSHWLDGVVLIGYTGIKITETTNGRDTDGNYVVINYTTDQDKEENHSYHKLIIHDETPPISVLDPSPNALVALHSHSSNGSTSGSFKANVCLRKSFSKPFEGELTIEKALLINISKKINDKHLKGCLSLIFLDI